MTFALTSQTKEPTLPVGAAIKKTILYNKKEERQEERYGSKAHRTSIHYY